MILDDVDPAIRANLESRGWLSLLEIDYPPPTALIREFFSNLSCHIYDSISFPHLFLRSLNEVHRSSAIGHALIHPIFIHRILLFLGLADFPASKPVHVVGPLGATFF